MRQATTLLLNKVKLPHTSPTTVPKLKKRPIKLLNLKQVRSCMFPKPKYNSNLKSQPGTYEPGCAQNCVHMHELYFMDTHSCLGSSFMLILL